MSRSSIGIHSLSATFEIKSLILLIQSIQDQIKTIEITLEQLLVSLNTSIISIPGISMVLAAMIVGEAGDTHRFGSPKKLLAYAGLDPTLYQSGLYSDPQSKLSKRGSKYPRYALMKATSIIYLHDETFKHYYTLKNPKENII